LRGVEEEESSMFGNKGGGLFGHDDIDPEDYKNCMMQGTGVDFFFK